MLQKSLHNQWKNKFIPVQTVNSPTLPEHFSPESRIWMYQSNRELSSIETAHIKAKLEDYTSEWKAHGKAVKGFATVVFNRFILIMADESQHQVSGCSIDGSVRLLKALETELDIRLFDRHVLCFSDDNGENIQHLEMTEIETALNNKKITPETLYFNNTVQSKLEFEEKWIIPVKESWLSRFM
jgi:hypothetical protein